MNDTRILRELLTRRGFNADGRGLSAGLTVAAQCRHATRGVEEYLRHNAGERERSRVRRPD